MKVYFLSILLILISCTGAFAQEPLSTLKTGNINHINPALVGAQSDFGVQARYSSQWNSVPGAPVAMSLRANYNFKSNIGIGLEVKKDNSYNSWYKTVKLNINRTSHIKNIELSYGGNIGYGK